MSFRNAARRLSANRFEGLGPGHIYMCAKTFHTQSATVEGPQMALHVQYGCGFHAPEGWLSFDASPTLRFERLPIVGRLYNKNSVRFPPGARYGNIVKGLPVPPGSVDKLYASHVLEHLAHDDAMKAIANSFAVLKPEGVFRLIVPDLRARAARYLQRADAEASSQFLDTTMLGQRHRPSGVMGMLSMLFGSSEHRWMWDEPALIADLRNAGFSSIRRCSFGDSNDPIFAQVENRDRFIDGEIEELAIECRRTN